MIAVTATCEAEVAATPSDLFPTPPPPMPALELPHTLSALSTAHPSSAHVSSELCWKGVGGGKGGGEGGGGEGGGSAGGGGASGGGGL